jgi:hypothetical protein
LCHKNYLAQIIAFLGENSRLTAEAEAEEKKFLINTRRDRPGVKALLEEIAKCRV